MSGDRDRGAVLWFTWLAAMCINALIWVGCVVARREDAFWKWALVWSLGVTVRVLFDVAAGWRRR